MCDLGGVGEIALTTKKKMKQAWDLKTVCRFTSHKTTSTFFCFEVGYMPLSTCQVVLFYAVNFLASRKKIVFINSTQFVYHFFFLEKKHKMN